MRIAFVDDVAERHALDSLERALVARGHEVLRTGPVWQGDRPPEDPADVTRIHEAVTDLLARRPEAVLVVRVATLLEEEVARFRDRGIVTAAWLPDDPVLFKVSTGKRARWYDVVLHTGAADVLDLYSRHAGTWGVSWPWFTDETAFPRADDRPGDGPVVFLGNTHTRVKRWREDWIRACATPVTVVGKIGGDPDGLSVEPAADDAEVASRLAGARIGLTMSQRFVDYAGTRYDFDELSGLGVFDVPSRVVQYAATGLPIIAKVDGEVPPFPCLTVDGPDEMAGAVARLDGDREFYRRLSDETYDWFRAGYTAASRALLLEHLLANPTITRGWPADYRAGLFRTFGAYLTV